MEKPHVVIAEDNPADVLLVRNALRLRNVGCELQVLTDGAEALDYIASAEQGAARVPDLVLLDLNLPKHTGGEVLARLRQSEICGTVPVVIMTSSSSPHDRELVNNLGISHYFLKPADLSQFLKIGEIVDEMIGDRSTAQDPDR